MFIKTGMIFNNTIYKRRFIITDIRSKLLEDTSILYYEFIHDNRIKYSQTLQFFNNMIKDGIYVLDGANF